MQLQGLTGGPQVLSDGTQGQPSVNKQGALWVTEFIPRYYELVYRGLCFTTSEKDVNPTGAIPLGAAGTPLLAIWNPAGTGKNIVVLQIGISIQIMGTGALGGVYASWGITTAITQATKNTIYNALTSATSGSAATAFNNVALTGSTALTQLMPLLSVGANVTSTTPTISPALLDIGGAIIIPPGSVFALTTATSGTAAKVDSNILWAELSV